MYHVDTRLSSDSDGVASGALTVPTVMRLAATDSVSVTSGDSQHQMPYQMMLDDNTSMDRASYSDTEGLLRGERLYLVLILVLGVQYHVSLEDSVFVLLLYPPSGWSEIGGDTDFTLCPSVCL